LFSFFFIGYVYQLGVFCLCLFSFCLFWFCFFPDAIGFGKRADDVDELEDGAGRLVKGAHDVVQSLRGLVVETRVAGDASTGNSGSGSGVSASVASAKPGNSTGSNSNSTTSTSPQMQSPRQASQAGASAPKSKRAFLGFESESQEEDKKKND
jgi:hypothetical protein